jgi:hypothetical protein
MVQAGGSALAPMPHAVSKPGVRSPMMVTVLTFVTCGLYGVITLYMMLSELKAYLNKEEIVPWHLFVPILGIIVLVGKLPDWVTEAKQRAGSRNQQSAGPIMYFLLAPYFVTKDLNEVWDPMGASD